MRTDKEIMSDANKHVKAKAFDKIQAKTKAFLKQIKADAKNTATTLNAKSIKALDSNRSLKMSVTDFEKRQAFEEDVVEEQSLYSNENINKITITPSKQSVSLNLNKDFCYKVFGKVYGINLYVVVSELSNIFERATLNKMLNKELKENPEVFLNAL